MGSACQHVQNCRKETNLYYHGLPVCVDCGASGVIPEHILPDAPKEEIPTNESATRFMGQ